MKRTTAPKRSADARSRSKLQTTRSFTQQNAQNTNGPILNFYGCLTEPIDGFSPFIRAPGPMRLIGCVVDGAMGGGSTTRLRASYRFSGNLSGGVAWSLGKSFTRPIADALFFQNNTAVKAGVLNGAFTDCTFADSNGDIINAGSATRSAVQVHRLHHVR